MAKVDKGKGAANSSILRSEDYELKQNGVINVANALFARAKEVGMRIKDDIDYQLGHYDISDKVFYRSSKQSPASEARFDQSSLLAEKYEKLIHIARNTHNMDIRLQIADDLCEAISQVNDRQNTALMKSTNNSPQAIRDIYTKFFLPELDKYLGWRENKFTETDMCFRGTALVMRNALVRNQNTPVDVIDDCIAGYQDFRENEFACGQNKYTTETAKKAAVLDNLSFLTNVIKYRAADIPAGTLKELRDDFEDTYKKAFVAFPNGTLPETGEPLMSVRRSVSDRVQEFGLEPISDYVEKHTAEVTREVFGSTLRTVRRQPVPSHSDNLGDMDVEVDDLVASDPSFAD